MMYKSEDITMAALSAGAFLLALIVSMYLYVQIQNSRTYIAEVSGQIARAAGEEQAQELTKQALANTADERAKLDALALRGDAAADFIDAVESEARVAGVSLEVGNVASVPREGVFDELTLSLKATGSFPALSRFLKLLETLPYASSVHTAVFDSDTQKAGAWTLVASVGVPQHKQ